MCDMTQLLNNASLGESASYCLQRRGKNSLGTLFWESKGNNFRGLLGHFGVAFGDDLFDNTCGHRINAKFHQILVEISNLLYQRVPKSRSTFVEEKINLNTNQFIFHTNAERNGRIFKITLIKLIEDQRLG